jgi:hypothetical protein
MKNPPSSEWTLIDRNSVHRAILSHMMRSGVKETVSGSQVQTWAEKLDSIMKKDAEFLEKNRVEILKDLE